MWAVLGIALITLVTTGCERLLKDESSSKKDAPPPAPKPPPAPPSDSTQSQEPQPPQPFIVHFGDDWRASAAHLKLLEVGVQDETWDVGCSLSGRTVGKGDRVGEPCEVRGFILGSYPLYPQATRALTADPIPWGLDDFDAKTPFDDGIRKKVNAAVESLKNSLQITDVKTASEEQVRKLALGLYHFVQFPDWPERIEADSANLRKSTEELKNAGMKDFQDYLFQKGGLGVSLFVKVPGGDPHLSALEALQGKIGSDFSRANILFGVLTFAGLQPRFFNAPLSSVSPDGKPEVHEGQLRVDKRFSVLLGLPLVKNKETLMFNPSFLDSKRDFANAKVDTLSRYLGAYLFACGTDGFIRIGKFDSGVNALRRTLDITPADDLTHMALGFAYTRLNNNELAEFNFRESLRLNPNNQLANYYLGNVLYQAGKRKEALPHYLNAVKDRPGWTEPQGATIIPMAVQETLAIEPDPTAQEIKRELQEDSKGVAPEPSTSTVIWER
jgi:hypothetical protein